MTIYLGADHRGFALKQNIFSLLKEAGHNPQDMGNITLDPGDDYPDFAFAVCREVAKDPGARGILVCGSGIGMSIAANKVKGIRAGLAYTPPQAVSGRHDDDINVLVLHADSLSTELAWDVVRKFLTTPFAASERYARRLQKISNFENAS